ncbi:aryl-alcohol oxidase [Coprinopsis cinerea okayama7|uniref:pyranose dehydrogenase (acceptor) n=1 Tax=Coprinopsis cinerea (strain Okayama-7 / 130 / ATCC MYA-4618 / FGSC 9003) TaxID=240176 RepID=A8NM48_COPC7|nr:aryl-alcohol oxidase [Coprinopsis cinerea okayama7\|eukprot:XP_001834845.2 aryl-alcohol oxidase [Coprinopsis cinerea okayama7\
MNHIPLGVTLLVSLALPAFATIQDSITKFPKTDYDFIVVGGGQAGCVVANRLTENPRFNVLVIEAGPSHEGVLDAQVPGFVFNLSNTTYEYNYTSVATPHLNNRVFPNSPSNQTIDGMFYTRGSSSDYDRWATVTGDSNWSWKKLFPYILKHERWVEPNRDVDTAGMYNPKVHNTKGMTFVSLTNFPDDSDAKVRQAADEIGGDFRWNLDYNSGDPLGVGWGQYTIGNGERSSAATAYLAPRYLKRKNLHVLINHRVTKLLQTGHGGGHVPTFRTVAFQEEMNPSAPIQKITARKEVILSAGAIGTPQPKVDLPSVGKNLTEHPAIAVSWKLGINGTFNSYVGHASCAPRTNLGSFLSSADPTLPEKWFQEWQNSRTGPLTHIRTHSAAFIRLPDDSPIYNQHPDPSSGRSTPQFEIPITLRIPLVFPPLYFQWATKSFLLVTGGWVKLASTNVYDQPLIDVGMLKSEFDWYGLRETIRASKRFFSAPAWESYQLTLEPPFNTDVDEELNEAIKAAVSSGAHPVGTASMSPKNAQWGVVDPDLRVKKVKGLRIVDASIMPFIVSAHTQAAVYAIAERGSDLIKHVWK